MGRHRSWNVADPDHNIISLTITSMSYDKCPGKEARINDWVQWRSCKIHVVPSVEMEAEIRGCTQTLCFVLLGTTLLFWAWC